MRKKKIKVHFLLIGVFRKYPGKIHVLCASMGNGSVEGAITCTVKHRKVYYSKNAP